MGVITNRFKERYTEFWLHVINNPKSSLSGLYSFLAILCLCAIPFIPTTWKVVSAVASGISGSFKLWNALTAKDPGTVPATTPQNPIPHPEPSTELPINPDATVVVQK